MLWLLSAIAASVLLDTMLAILMVIAGVSTVSRATAAYVGEIDEKAW